MASGLFPVIDASTWELIGTEPDGLNEHPWVRAPATGDLWLSKPVTYHGPLRRGEDWAEKISSALAQSLGIPTAQIELAVRDGRSGCLSRSLTPRGWELQPGALLLADTLPGYEPGLKGAPGHSLSNIDRALVGFSAPPGADLPPSFSAFDVFAGYLVLDALIANRDRHERNWAILRPPPGVQAADALCGAYDHGSALGFNLSDDHRRGLLDRGGVRTWARRGDAYRFERAHGARRSSLVEHAAAGLLRCPVEVRRHWLDAVDALVPSQLTAIVRAVPDLSEVTAIFLIEVLTINRERLLHD